MSKTPKGYAVTVSDFGNRAEHIERIDEMNIFANDEEAAIQAEKDGFRIIHDLYFPDERDRAAYIDTPENRKKLAPCSVQLDIPQTAIFESHPGCSCTDVQGEMNRWLAENPVNVLGLSSSSDEYGLVITILYTRKMPEKEKK